MDPKMRPLFQRKLTLLAVVVAALGSLPAAVNGQGTLFSSPVDRGKDSIRPALGPGPWHWENPRPQGNTLTAVFVLGPDDVWTGGSGTLMHWDGNDWRLTEVPLSSEYQLAVSHIWGSDPDNIWLAANTDLFTWQDEAWQPSGLPSFPYILWGPIWGTAADDVWTASQGAVYHWDGAWSERTPDSWQYGGAPSLWGMAVDDVTVRDGWNHYFRWDGSRWESIASPPGLYVGGTGPGEPWFYDFSHRLFLRFRAGAWETYASPVLTSFAAWSDGSLEAWALGRDGGNEDFLLHFDGKGWSIDNSVADRLRGIGGSAPDSVWSVGEKGAIVRFNGSYEERRAGSVADLNRVFGLSEEALWAVGNSGIVLRRTPQEWEVTEIPTQRDLFDVHGTAGNDVWAVGAAGTALHFDGKTWSNVPTGIPDALVAVWASSPFDAWAATPQYPYHPFLHWDGTQWSQSTVGAPAGTVHGFWGFAPNDVWAVGGQCNYIIDDFICVKATAHFDGSSWTVQYVGGGSDDGANRFVAVWGNDPQDVWALTGYSAMYHWDGSCWSQVDFPQQLYWCSGLWGAGKDGVFATCGTNVVHWDGSAWSLLPTLSAQRLTAVCGAATKVWVVGQGGTILRYDASNQR